MALTLTVSPSRKPESLIQDSFRNLGNEMISAKQTMPYSMCCYLQSVHDSHWARARGFSATQCSNAKWLYTNEIKPWRALFRAPARCLAGPYKRGFKHTLRKYVKKPPIFGQGLRFLEDTSPGQGLRKVS